MSDSEEETPRGSVVAVLVLCVAAVWICLAWYRAFDDSQRSDLARGFRCSISPVVVLFGAEFRGVDRPPFHPLTGERDERPRPYERERFFFSGVGLLCGAVCSGVFYVALFVFGVMLCHLACPGAFQ